MLESSCETHQLLMNKQMSVEIEIKQSSVEEDNANNNDALQCGALYLLVVTVVEGGLTSCA